jgi:hypothetical protein
VTPEVFQRQLAEYELALVAALRTQYQEIFQLTVLVCVLGAALALLMRSGSGGPSGTGAADDSDAGAADALSGRGHG